MEDGCEAKTAVFFICLMKTEMARTMAVVMSDISGNGDELRAH